MKTNPFNHPHTYKHIHGQIQQKKNTNERRKREKKSHFFNFSYRIRINPFAIQRHIVVEHDILISFRSKQVKMQNVNDFSMYVCEREKECAAISHAVNHISMSSILSLRLSHDCKVLQTNQS